MFIDSKGGNFRMFSGPIAWAEDSVGRGFVNAGEQASDPAPSQMRRRWSICRIWMKTHTSK